MPTQQWGCWAVFPAGCGWTYRFLHRFRRVQQPLNVQAALLQEAQAMVTRQRHVFFGHSFKFCLSLSQPDRTGSWKTNAGGQRLRSISALTTLILLHSSSFASWHQRKPNSLASCTDCSWFKETFIHTQVHFTPILKHEEQMALHSRAVDAEVTRLFCSSMHLQSFRLPPCFCPHFLSPYFRSGISVWNTLPARSFIPISAWWCLEFSFLTLGTRYQLENECISPEMVKNSLRRKRNC